MWDVELKYAEIESPLGWHQLFGNAPVAIEIGFGKCGFLLALAAQHPTSYIVGIESSRKYYRKGVAKLQRAGVANTKIIWGEAAHIVQCYVPDQSVTAIYINFPDPWPKKRHAKRRLIRTEVISVFAQKLKPDGWIELATDSEAYIKQAQEIFQDSPRYVMRDYHTSNHHGPIRACSSDYEIMFLKEGKTIYYVTYGLA